MTPRAKDRIASAVTGAGALAGLYFSFVGIGRWAADAFVRPELASVLVAALEVVLACGVLVLAPGVSLGVRRMLR
jgi:hypothetical protein